MGRERVEREGLGRAIRERESGVEEGIMEKNQAKRIQAGDGDGQNVRERVEANI